MTCAELTELLLEFVEGDLADEPRQGVEAHLAGCPDCAARCREMRRMVLDLGAARSVDGEISSMDAGELPSAVAAPASGWVGDFELLEEIGRGGMGVVYRARQKSLDRVVALKLLSGPTPLGLSRFTNEARAAARLHHTNIVTVYAQGEYDGRFFYAMELIDGQPLDRVLRADPVHLRLPVACGAASAGQRPVSSEIAGQKLLDPGGTADADSATRSAVHSGGRRARDYTRLARLLAEVADGLHYAHEHRIVHRDIKLQNLLLGRDDRLHITDFGLARLLDEPGVTRSTDVVGTPAYMAPEQIAGGRHEIDGRTDVYALGAAMYELLTLRRPFGGTHEQVIAQILRAEPKSPRRTDPHIPVDLETICLRALEKEPERRFQSAEGMARDLRRYAEGFPIRSRRISLAGRAWRYVRRNPARAAVMAAVGVIAVLAPALAIAGRAYARQRVERAYEVLLSDYRHGDDALARLDGWGWLSGDPYTARLVEAFAHIRGAPEQSVRLAEELVTRAPEVPDGHYLLAWAYVRRMAQEGHITWAEARRQIELGDQAEGAASAAGHFFRAQALWGFDPRAAERAFERAIVLRPNFVQAMLHQARAMNQIMYFLREPGYYQKAVSNLGFVCDAQRTEAYPRYLLAITHTLAAEMFATNGDQAAADEAYEAGLAVAREAQQVEPRSSRGYAAEAQCQESRGDFRAALAAWDRMRPPAVELTRSDWSERAAYRMRLHFWLGEYEAAEQARVERYGPQAGYDSAAAYDADEALYKILIALGRGDREAAGTAWKDGMTAVGQHAEEWLLLASVAPLIVEPSVVRAAGELDFNTRLSPRWTAEWVRALARYQADEITWSDLSATLEREAAGREERRILLAGAAFHRGMKALAAGDRAAAEAAFAESWQQFDNENYTFRAKMVLFKLRVDSAWLTRS